MKECKLKVHVHQLHRRNKRHEHAQKNLQNTLHHKGNVRIPNTHIAYFYLILSFLHVLIIVFHAHQYFTRKWEMGISALKGRLFQCFRLFR